MLEIKQLSDGISFKVKVQPKASKNEICGYLDDALKIRLTAPPVDGAANEAVVSFFAKLFRLSKSQVEIISGHTGRNKVLKIKNISLDQAKGILPKEG